MNIVFISYEFLPAFMGGIGTYVHHASRMLTEAGHNVSVICCGQSTDSSPVEGVDVYPVMCKQRTDFHYAAANTLRDLLSIQTFDVLEVPDLYAEGLSALIAFPWLPSVMRLHTPVVVSSWVDQQCYPWIAVVLQSLRVGLAELKHGRFPRNALRIALGRLRPDVYYDPLLDLERQAALLATVLVSPSQSLARKVEKIWRIPFNSVHVSPNPSYQSSSRAECSLLWPENCKVSCHDTTVNVLYFGGLKSFKGVDLLVRAIVPLLRQNPRLRLTLAGTASPSPLASLTISAFLQGNICQWREMGEWLESKTAGVGASVTILPWQSRAEIEKLLDKSDLCVFPSRYDNFPGACLEAMAAGKAIVATSSGGMAEMLRHGVDGWLVPPYSFLDLRVAIKRLTKDAQLRHRLGLAAKKRFMSCYSAEHILDTHVSFYERAIIAKKI